MLVLIGYVTTACSHNFHEKRKTQAKQNRVEQSRVEQSRVEQSRPTPTDRRHEKENYPILHPPHPPRPTPKTQTLPSSLTTLSPPPPSPRYATPLFSANPSSSPPPLPYLPEQEPPDQAGQGPASTRSVKSLMSTKRTGPTSARSLTPAIQPPPPYPSTHSPPRTPSSSCLRPCDDPSVCLGTSGEGGRERGG